MSERQAGLPAALSTGSTASAAPRAVHSKLRRWLRWTTLVLLVLLIGGAAYAGITVWQFMNTVYHPYTPPPFHTATPETLPTAPRVAPVEGVATWTPAPTSTPDPAQELPPGRVNILVLGTDKRPELQEEAARSDTLIILSVDPEQKTAGVLSVPRDLQVTLPGYGLQRINSAYFFGEYDKLPGGGPALAVPVVSSYFNVPIPYYVAVNFDGFQKIVDMIGGIDMNVPEELDDPEYPGPYNSTIHIHFYAGCQHMEGERALEYARTRHPDSDFGRALRQQQVISAIRLKALSLNMLTRYPDILHQLGDSIETNIPPDKQVAFAQLAGQIKTQDIYSAQIDSTMVTQVPSGALVLRTDTAKPMLDWFFGRGIYANGKGGGIRPLLMPTATIEGHSPKLDPATPKANQIPVATAMPTYPPTLPTAGLYEAPPFATARAALLSPGQCR